MPKRGEYTPIRFPKDESAHNFIVEWWYFNGHVCDKSGNQYSFMDCLFKIDNKKVHVPILSRLPVKTVYFSHSLISDLKAKKFYPRTSPFSIISEDSFTKPLLYINYLNPELKNGYTNCAIEQLNTSTYRVKNERIDLTLVATKQPLLEGGRGFLDLKSSTTYYYSLTNLRTEGRIKIKNKWVEVTGKSWMDHQWSNVGFAKNGWNWFCAQLENNTELVCCMFDDGKDKTYFADISYPDGRQDHFADVQIKPLGKNWTSPQSKAVYPVAWELEIPAKKLKLTFQARIANQEMLSGFVNYWEGPMAVQALVNGKKIRGQGFMELVGYPSKYNDVHVLEEDIEEDFNRLFKLAKAKTAAIVGNNRQK